MPPLSVVTRTSVVVAAVVWGVALAVYLAKEGEAQYEQLEEPIAYGPSSPISRDDTLVEEDDEDDDDETETEVDFPHRRRRIRKDKERERERELQVGVRRRYGLRPPDPDAELKLARRISAMGSPSLSVTTEIIDLSDLQDLMLPPASFDPIGIPSRSRRPSISGVPTEVVGLNDLRNLQEINNLMTVVSARREQLQKELAELSWHEEQLNTIETSVALGGTPFTSSSRLLEPHEPSSQLYEVEEDDEDGPVYSSRGASSSTRVIEPASFSGYPRASRTQSPARRQPLAIMGSSPQQQQHHSLSVYPSQDISQNRRLLAPSASSFGPQHSRGRVSELLSDEDDYSVIAGYGRRVSPFTPAIAEIDDASSVSEFSDIHTISSITSSTLSTSQSGTAVGDDDSFSVRSKAKFQGTNSKWSDAGSEVHHRGKARANGRVTGDYV